MSVPKEDKPLQKKRLGQVFLRSIGSIRKVLSFAGFRPEDAVLEIGGGDGRVSVELALLVERLCVVEIDPLFLNILQKRFAEQKKIVVVAGDILAPATLSSSLAALGSGRIGVYGSIPYYITTQIVRWLLENRIYIRRAVLLMQKEVARRLAASHGSKEYGFTSILVQLGAGLRLGPVVGRGEFKPVPKVDSQVIEIDLDAAAHRKLDPRFIEMVSQLFNQRRKMIGTTLKSIVHDRVDAEERLSRLDISLRMRPEQLTPEQHLLLFNTLFESVD